MDMFRKLANGAVRSGILGAGLLGLYLVREKRIPECMNFVSYCMTCVGLYTLITYVLEVESETDDTDQDCTRETNMTNDSNSAVQHNLPDTPKSKKEWGIARRIFLNEFKKEADKIFCNYPEMGDPYRGKTESKNIEGIFIKLSDLAMINQNAPDDVSDLLQKVSDKLGEIKAEEEGITIRTSPMQLEMLDIKIQNPVIEDASETALTQYVKDIIHELQVGEFSLLIAPEKKVVD